MQTARGVSSIAPGAHRWLFGGLLVAALAIRLLAAVLWQERVPERFGFPDSVSYWHLAGQIVQGKPYQFGSADAQVFRSPGYPVVLAGWFALAGSSDPPLWWGRLLSVLCGTATVAAAYYLARTVARPHWNEPACGLLAAALVCVQPELIGLSVFILSEAVFTPLLVVQLTVTWQAWQTTNIKTACWLAGASGLLAGAATLVRPSWLLFLPLVAVPLTLAVAKSKRWPLVLAMLLAWSAIQAPWWIRNAVVTGQFVPTTLQVGASLYDGWNPAADGSSQMEFVPRFEQTVRDERSVAGLPAEAGTGFEVALDARLKQEATAWAAEHPGRVAELAVIKVARFWSPFPNEPQLRRSWFAWLIAVGFVPLVFVAAAGFWVLRRQLLAVVWLWLPMLYFTLLHSLFVSSIRYREPELAPLCGVAAVTMVAAWHAWHGASQTTMSASGS